MENAPCVEGSWIFGMSASTYISPLFEIDLNAHAAFYLPLRYSLELIGLKAVLSEVKIVALPELMGGIL